jgi:sugar phosphate permease
MRCAADNHGTQVPVLMQSKHRLFYGWLIVFIAFCEMFVISGAFVTFGQFIGPLSQAFGWSVGFIGLASTIRQLTGMGAALLIGRLTDSAGPRKIMAAGALLAGSAYCLLAVVRDPAVFFLLFSVVVAIGFSMIGGTPAQAAVAYWFRRKRGLALAIMSMGGSLGGVVMAPVVQYLLGSGDWRVVFAVTGGGILIVLLPLVALGMHDRPEPMGLSQDGDGPTMAAAAVRIPGIRVRQPASEQTWSYLALLRSEAFWMLTVGYLFASSLYTLIEVYQFSILTSRGVDGTSAALYISIYSLSAALSKFGWGYLADRVDLRKLTMLALCANGLSLGTLAFATTVPLFWLYTLVGGASGGGQSSLLPALIAQKFGHRSFGTVAGLFLPFGMIAPALLVPLAGFAFDMTHTYDLVFVGVGGLAIACAAALLRLPRNAAEGDFALPSAEVQ